MQRQLLKQGNAALKQGNTTLAIRNAQQVLQKNPGNIFAKRLMAKVKTRLLGEAQKNYDAGNYQEAVAQLETLLELDPQNEKAKEVHANAKKHVLLSDAKASLEKDNPMAAMASLKEALRLDPQFQEAKNMQVEASQKVEEKIANLMTTAEMLIAQDKFEELRKLAQDILSIDPQNREAAELLREAQAQILARDKEANLAMARRFYEEQRYESALSKAEEVLKVDANSTEAKQLVERSQAELAKPALRLTGITKIKGMLIAHIEIPSTNERFNAKEGDNFGDFKVSAIDLDLKAVVVTYLKTGSQSTITTSGD
jgi:tetratricopeptide (TPR) repeat protein